jgi:hypothetical protein
MKKRKAVTSYARMWPRELFNCKRGKRSVVKEIEMLSQPGVYVLYRDDEPYYVGKAARLRSRLWLHANRPTSRYYNLWNHFSAFVVQDADIRNQLEGVLIAAMPTANGAKPRIKKSKLPLDVQKQLHSRLYQPLQLKIAAKAATA